jgi:hypothetical protein
MDTPDGVIVCVKRCSTCKILKKVEEFHKRSDTRSGLVSDCKSCRKVKQEMRREAKRVYDRLRTREKRDEISAKRKIYRLEHKEEKKQYDQRVSERVNEKRRLRYREDRSYRLMTLLRNRIRSALLGRRKAQGSEELLGCSKEYFALYFESLFSLDMTWSHVLSGEIHIDHIVPCAAFDLSDPEQQRRCFHYTNLQPLWGPDNNQKRVSVPTPDLIQPNSPLSRRK